MKRRTPQSYDEIVRQTVPEPDSSFRPTPQQIEDTRLGVRALDTAERALRDTVMEALAGFDGIRVEVERRRVTLSGRVPNPMTMQRILVTIGRIGDIEVVDRMYIAPVVAS